MHVVYLHGFASSPASSKAQFLSSRLAAAGVRMHCPDLNKPDFSTLTVSRMLRQLEGLIAALPAGDVVLIGSSLGGFVAVEAARRSRPDHRVVRLVLLAPAVELAWERWSEIRAGGIDQWRRDGDIEVFHYAENRPCRLRFAFYEDAVRYDPASARLNMPMLIFQGRRDESVDPASVERFSQAQPDSTLHLLDDTHQLKNSLDFIWQETSRALSLAAPAVGPASLDKPYN